MSINVIRLETVLGGGIRVNTGGMGTSASKLGKP